MESICIKYPKPSVEGNSVIFYNYNLDYNLHLIEDLETRIKVLYGSLEVDMIRGIKIFKNYKNQVYKIEKFDPIIVRVV